MYMETPEKLGGCLDKAVDLRNAMHKAFFFRIPSTKNYAAENDYRKSVTKSGREGPA